MYLSFTKNYICFRNPQIIRIKPSVELRLCSREDRKKYQATAISWSKVRGHIINKIDVIFQLRFC